MLWWLCVLVNLLYGALCTVSPVMITAWSLDPSGALVDDPSAHQHTVVDWPHLPISAGIFIVSLSGGCMSVSVCLLLGKLAFAGAVFVAVSDVAPNA